MLTLLRALRQQKGSVSTESYGLKAPRCGSEGRNDQSGRASPPTWMYGGTRLSMAHLRCVLVLINSSCIAIFARQCNFALLLAWFRIDVCYYRVLLFEFAVAGKACNDPPSQYAAKRAIVPQYCYCRVLPIVSATISMSLFTLPLIVPDTHISYLISITSPWPSNQQPSKPTLSTAARGFNRSPAQRQGSPSIACGQATGEYRSLLQSHRRQRSVLLARRSPPPPPRPSRGLQTS